MTLEQIRDELAEHIANGASIREAGKRLGMTKGQTAGHWNRLVKAMGEQAK